MRGTVSVGLSDGGRSGVGRPGEDEPAYDPDLVGLVAEPRAVTKLGSLGCLQLCAASDERSVRGVDIHVQISRFVGEWDDDSDPSAVGHIDLEHEVVARRIGGSSHTVRRDWIGLRERERAGPLHELDLTPDNIEQIGSVASKRRVSISSCPRGRRQLT
jgi:hypothetical protein